jgi:DNA-binding GntR family transcriptional regulator
MKRIGNQSLRVGRSAPGLRERATVKIRNAILQIHYKPHQKLTERMLCAEIGVSRTSIREALRQLEAEGLVERIPRRGMMVAAVSPSEARQIYEVRFALEPSLSRLFVQRASAKDVEALKSACDEIERDIDRQPITYYVQSIDRFFDVLMRGADNEVARSILRNLRARINYLRALTAEASGTDRERETLEIMRGVVDAAVRRDADDIAQRCRSMVERSARYAIALLTKLEEEPTTEPERRVVRRKRVLVPSGLKRSSSEVSQDR